MPDAEAAAQLLRIKRCRIAVILQREPGLRAVLLDVEIFRQNKNPVGLALSRELDLRPQVILALYNSD